MVTIKFPLVLGAHRKQAAHTCSRVLKIDLYTCILLRHVNMFNHTAERRLFNLSWPRPMCPGKQRCRRNIAIRKEYLY